jgi:hypothetical protein
VARIGFVLLAVVAAAIAAPFASASQLIDRNATGVQLAVNAKGEALLTYKKSGKVMRVLAWGAVDAVAPDADAPQTELELDYAGGWGKYYGNDPAVKKLQVKYKRLKASGKPYLTSPAVKQLSAKSAFARTYATKSFRGSCPKYTGPKLAWFVTACTAADGSHWAVQSWQRQLPNYGLAPNATQSVWELRLSHWTTDLPVLKIDMDWAWRKWDHLYGTYTYRGRPVYGFASTPSGQPLDAFGRNLYVDTLDSAYGAGWRRENSFLTHKGTGAFCYSVNPHGPHPAGNGVRYRATIQGPGVTPDVMWEGVPRGSFDKDADAVSNQAIAAMNDSVCRPN